LLAIRDSNRANTADQWTAIAEQWDRLAEAYEAGDAIKKRFREITRQSRTRRRRRRARS